MLSGSLLEEYERSVAEGCAYGEMLEDTGAAASG
jgi:hypothetical protein